MKIFRVMGEYGIQSGQYVERFYFAKSWETARERFIKEMKKDYPDDWPRMRHNVSTYELTGTLKGVRLA